MTVSVPYWSHIVHALRGEREVVPIKDVSRAVLSAGSDENDKTDYRRD
jgi:hypothetical protein